MTDSILRSCVHPSGRFVYGIHRPSYKVENLRIHDYVCALGWCEDSSECINRVNFPPGPVSVPAADPVFEIPNAFAFRGVTFILKRWADAKARQPDKISLPAPPRVSFTKAVQKWIDPDRADSAGAAGMLADLPGPVQLALAETSTDQADLVRLAELSCRFIHDEKTGQPLGLQYRDTPDGRREPAIRNFLLFEITANNIHLPDVYKEAMVLRPGIQGDNEIVGESADPEAGTHVFEYLRQNSYIPGGHYAANNAHDAVRYRLADLSFKDMQTMRHFYYQRSFIRLAGQIEIDLDCRRRQLRRDELENLRCDLVKALGFSENRENLTFNRTLWGWNFGFDYAPSGYRLHASHQQIHQQYAMIPVDFEPVPKGEAPLKPFACGDMIDAFISYYYRQTGVRFFDAYIRAIYNNERMDDTKGEKSLIIHSDENVMLFVPKAQTSQWELQLMAIPPVGHILDACQSMRDSIDYGMLVAVRVLEAMGARMITSFEYSKAIDHPEDNGQRLIYTFLPRLPESPGAFSESQMRWINGHYPEDFAAACRSRLNRIHSAIQ